LLAILAASATAGVLPEDPKGQLSGLSVHISESNLTTVNLPAFDPDDVATAVGGEDVWTLSVQRGTKLFEGMKVGDKEAASLYGMGASAESPYGGDLHDTLLAWGYNNNTCPYARTA
jgi:hypothetical protein